MLTMLRVERMKQGLPLWRMAQLLGVSPATVSKIEMGRITPSEETLQRMAEILGYDCGREKLLEKFN